MIIKTKAVVTKTLPHEEAIKAAIEQLTLTGDCSFDDVRNKLIADGEVLEWEGIPDGHIHQVALDNSFDVEV